MQNNHQTELFQYQPTRVDDLYSFAYLTHWPDALKNLEALALPESWRFKNPSTERKNTQNPILERYICSMFRKVYTDYIHAPQSERDYILYTRNEITCFHTGLFTRKYKPIYMIFERAKRAEARSNWILREFADDSSSWLKKVNPLPLKPIFLEDNTLPGFIHEWTIRVNVDHILSNPENLLRIPAEMRSMENLPLILEAAVIHAMRRASIEPGIIVPNIYHGNLQFLLPLCLRNLHTPDMALALSMMDGFYYAHTALTLEMSYTSARLLARPSVSWLLDLLDGVNSDEQNHEMPILQKEGTVS